MLMFTAQRSHRFGFRGCENSTLRFKRSSTARERRQWKATFLNPAWNGWRDLRRPGVGNRLRCQRLDEREMVGRRNQDRVAVPGKASERAVKLPFVAFDNAPLAAREVNSQSHDVPLSLVAMVDGAEFRHEVTPSQTWYAHPGF